MKLSGRRVVVTGVIAGESRATAEQKLREAGALVQSSVSGTTDLLITGGRVGTTKTTKAAELGVTVVTWEQVWTTSPVVAAGLTLEEAAAAQEYVEESGYDDPVRQIGPMLCKADDLPAGPGWLFEIKWDGLRCITTVRNGQVTMQSRSGKSDYVEQFPNVVRDLADFPDCVLDGELVQLDQNGHSFGMGTRTNGGSYVVFDVLDVQGQSVRDRPLAERRLLLDTIVNGEVGRDPEHVVVSPASADGPSLLDYAAQHRLEGVVAKRLSGNYREGRRDWIKTKIRNEQEFVVVGWTPGKGEREGRIGALVVAVNENGCWVYCGRVGTGGTIDEIDDQRLTARDRYTAAELYTGTATRADLRDVTWVDPDVVVQVAFQRWTEDGRLFHPSVLRIRDDKDPRDVTRAA